jgi:hypothetical protein
MRAPVSRGAVPDGCAVDHRTVGLVLWMGGKIVRFDVSLPEHPAMVSDR